MAKLINEFICGDCGKMIVGDHKDFVESGWQRHPYGQGKAFLMCNECEAKYVDIWKEHASA